ncbi:TAFII28-domain-containing protein [Panus rudis PR-1116 ss-1]|nr:TAFII28-domain-containing protein [Panus rudis PR-1116 ss-1]
MSSPFANYPVPERSFISSNPTRGVATPTRGSGAKRGRKPKGTLPPVNVDSSRQPSQASPSSSQPTNVQWPNVQTPGNTTPATNAGTFSAVTSPAIPPPVVAGSSDQAQSAQDSVTVVNIPSAGAGTPAATREGTPAVKAEAPVIAVPGAEEDGEVDDEMLPAMADDDYSAQLSFQSQSKENLKVLMDNLTPAQYDRFEAYRRHPLPKQAVRKVIQQTLGQQVSQPVAQIVAGVAKVFVGEMVEKGTCSEFPRRKVPSSPQHRSARAVQARRGETGPLAPDHLREAYRLYQHETGRVGAARPMKGKRVFTR